MTADVEAIHRHLDEHPDDATARLVLADLLDELGDGKAPGYRALGLLGSRPVDPRSEPWAQPGYHNGKPGYTLEKSPHARLPADWLAAIADTAATGDWWRVRPTRREIEDAAAEAFARLPPERQAELLAGRGL